MICFGVKLSFRLVPPVLVLRLGLQHPLSSEGGWRFCSTCRLSLLIDAMGACLQILAFADLKLSRLAASCADLWMLGGFCACSNGDLLCTSCDYS